MAAYYGHLTAAAGRDVASHSVDGITAPILFEEEVYDWKKHRGVKRLDYSQRQNRMKSRNFIPASLWFKTLVAAEIRKNPGGTYDPGGYHNERQSVEQWATFVESPGSILGMVELAIGGWAMSMSVEVVTCWKKVTGEVYFDTYDASHLRGAPEGSADWPKLSVMHDRAGIHYWTTVPKGTAATLLAKGNGTPTTSPVRRRLRQPRHASSLCRLMFPRPAQAARQRTPG